MAFSAASGSPWATAPRIARCWPSVRPRPSSGCSVTMNISRSSAWTRATASVSRREPAQGGDRDVEAAIEAPEGGVVLGVGHSLDEARQLGDVLRRGAACGQRGAAALERLAVVGDVAQVAQRQLREMLRARASRRELRVDGTDERPASAPPPRLEVARVAQVGECLPERHRRDAEALGQLALGWEAIADVEQPESDGLRDPPRCLLPERLDAQRGVHEVVGDAETGALS